MTEATAATGHLSIGEVLSLVQEDFPDVTISKIRFLESQGLIAPERTGSGYRKFYDADIERLRWILRQQRDHFLPLKVIKKMLDDGADLTDSVGSQPTLWSSAAEGDVDEAGAADSPAGVGNGESAPSPGAPVEPAGERADEDAARSSFRSPSHPAVASSPRSRPTRPRAEGVATGSSAGAARGSAPFVDDLEDRDTESPSSGAASPVHATGATGDAAVNAPVGPSSSGLVPPSAPAPGSEQSDTAATPERATGHGEHTATSSAPSSPSAAASEDARAAAAESLERPAHSTPADVVAALQEDPRSARRGRRSGVGRTDEAPTEAAPTTGVDTSTDQKRPSAGSVAPTPPLTSLLSAEELCELCGIEPELLSGLEQYGLVVPASLGGRSAYDAEAVDVVRIAARYAELGVEPRHLRMYKVSAEREAGFVEQLVVPLIKQRNPAARQQATDRCDDLLAMGAELHAALLRRQLGRILGT